MKEEQHPSQVARHGSVRLDYLESSTTNGLVRGHLKRTVLGGGEEHQPWVSLRGRPRRLYSMISLLSEKGEWDTGEGQTVW